MANILKRLATLAPQVHFKAGDVFFWSPAKQLITYRPEALAEPVGHWALLHELAHALLGHTHYRSDLELLLLEVAAWDKARALGRQLDLEIDDEHIQDCLDTYRDWLHQRSTCPTCGAVSLQQSSRQYRCFNCSTTWQVSASRFCRPYRMRKYAKKESRPGTVPQATFQ